MAEQTSIQGTVAIRSDDAARVAFDLMRDIASGEFESTKAEQKKRDYWLKLYVQCFHVAKYGTLKTD